VKNGEEIGPEEIKEDGGDDPNALNPEELPIP